ncbi:LLM class flavin-dependent oxidoreductase [Mucilaginibacter sp. BJC16-A38]|uniref:LLM class flavin-dependent oxidoreductase n=1 Tax=Mucilaginibacter phenanthrenivorans TaxID=1234842 RepID=UPI0021585B6D|nr:LLM class flavin-dependent oxidoreductase [Mucilaginibacter phenanthrenivorans]MCR8557350.1 LLM class flavin-dependent oxidoreductase [Mucilaginibacter phenanthrenivorans]
MEIGVSTFGEIQPDSLIGKGFVGNRRMQEILQEVRLADEVGLDLFAFGEHHRPDFILSNPEIIMAAAAAITKRIRLSSAVTVLSTADPVRIFENFSTVDLISKGRTEIMVGKGAFTETFPLFGFAKENADELFSEHLDLLLAANNQEIVSWTGKYRQPVNGGVYPRPYQSKLPVWLAVSSTPASAVMAADLGLPLAVSMFGGPPGQFIPLIALYRETFAKKDPGFNGLQISIGTQFYTAKDSTTAVSEFYPGYERLMNRLAAENGRPLMNKEKFELFRKEGPLVVGSVQQVIDKIMLFYELFGNTRYTAHIDSAQIPHEGIMKAIELLGTEIAPVIRKETAKHDAIVE